VCNAPRIYTGIAFGTRQSCGGLVVWLQLGMACALPTNFAVYVQQHSAVQYQNTLVMS
jgi:hypothetical protein